MKIFLSFRWFCPAPTWWRAAARFLWQPSASIRRLASSLHFSVQLRTKPTRRTRNGRRKVSKMVVVVVIPAFYSVFIASPTFWKLTFNLFSSKLPFQIYKELFMTGIDRFFFLFIKFTSLWFRLSWILWSAKFCLFRLLRSMKGVWTIVLIFIYSQQPYSFLIICLLMLLPSQLTW